MNPIGKAFGSNITVYRAAYLVVHDYFSDTNIQDKFVAVSYVDEAQEPEALENLRKRADDSRKIPNHPNLLGIKPPFTHEGCFCITFPFMDLGSLRTIMTNRFPDGLPEACIVLALCEALRGLCTIHECGQVHREVSARHIFVSAEPKIKLAFGASVHDLSKDRDSDPSLFSGAKICEWAAAPEVYGRNIEYTPKADVWLVGIMALDLAYGGLKEPNRGGLNLLISKINKKKKLPKTYKGGDQGRKKVFSKGFQRMVVSCLELDPQRRPEEYELLLQEVFTPSNYDAFYLYDLFDLHMPTER